MGRSSETEGGMGIGTLPICDAGAKELEKDLLSVSRRAASLANMISESMRFGRGGVAERDGCCRSCWRFRKS